MSATFADMLRALRRRSALSQEGLARSAGMSASAISALERGERTKPYPHTVRALAEALALSDQDRQDFIDAAVGGSTPHPALSRNRAAGAASVPLTTFVGREDLIVLGVELLGSERLITLTGLGGIGKTRLAVELAERAAGLFPDGRWTVDVESSDDGTPVAQLVAVVLGLRDLAEDEHLDPLTEALGRRRCLLVLDGCERRTSDCAALAERLLTGCAGLVVLVTSQRPLHVQGEVIVALPPLQVPARDRGPSAETESELLFLHRARLAAPTAVLRDDELADIAELCRQLDGIPLAIELAAARTRMLPTAETLARMQDRFTLLHAAGDLPTRKRALSASLEWSCELLSPEEGELFRRLSVFTGGFSLHAVETGPGQDLPHPLEVMAALVDASLVVADARGTTARFRMLDTVRAYAGDLLDQTPCASRARQAHATYYLELAERCAPELQGPDQARFLRLLDEEHENLRVALAHWDSAPEPAVLVRLVTALSPYWVRRGRAREGQHWLDRVLSSNAPEAIPLPAFAAASDMCWITGDVAAQRLAAGRYLARATTAGDIVHRARATLYLSYSIRADALRADTTWQSLLTETTRLATDAGDAWTLAMVLNDTAAGANLEHVAAGRGQRCGDSLPQLREAVRLARSTGDLNLVAITLDSLAYAECRSGQPDEAMEHWSECLRELGDVIDPFMSAAVIEGIAQLAHLSSRHADCLVLLAATHSRRVRHAALAPALWACVLDDAAAASRAALPAEASAAAAVTGTALTWPDVVELALGPSAGRQAASRRGPGRPGPGC